MAAAVGVASSVLSRGWANAAPDAAAFDELPEGLRQLCSDVERDLAAEPAVVQLFRSAFSYTWLHAIRRLPGGYEFVGTGDIPDMWLRDSTAQLRPYLLAATDPAVADVVLATLRNQVRYVLTDPYANAFKAMPDAETNRSQDLPPPGPLVWERKYEVDSLAAVLQLGYALWRVTGRLDHVDADFRAACEAIVNLWAVEQGHPWGSPYTFRRTAGPHTSDTLPNDGRGSAVGPTGMTWSAFRPSDDPCKYGYLVPGNAMAAVSLAGLAELATASGLPELSARAAAQSAVIAAGVQTFGVVESGSAGSIYAYEVDGLGHSLLMDDANSPSLLALPYLGWCSSIDPMYTRTRSFVLSADNPYFFRGTDAAGVGSPHTPPGYVWPLALAMQGLTAPNADEQLALARLIARTDNNTAAVHESFDANDPGKFTRTEFGWGDALFSELVLAITGRSTAPFFPNLHTS
jgi:meiotically up-regulated gene 157 (Mug157) protein